MTYRGLVDIGKKELIEGVIVIFAIKDEKIGLAIGVTENLTKKYDAVKLVKIGSEIIGGKGGGGRSDFAQAGGVNKDNFQDLKSNGADVLVAGSYIFNSPDYNIAIDALK